MPQLDLPKAPASQPSAWSALSLSLAVLALPTCSWLWALLRFYRRFIYNEPSGTVWALSDDMYISACFGRSLWSGAGFLWYERAPHVEGISNPLWSAVIGALHQLPAFTEDRLGLFVVSLNAALLVSLVALFARTAISAGGRANTLTLSVAAALLLPWSCALCYWSAEGFEVALLAVIAFAAIYVALAPRTPRRALGLGLLLVAGLATRMDFVVLASAVCAVALAHDRGPRALLLWSVLVTGVLVGMLLVLRWAYYGDWLPNTYYLKTTGWPWAARLQRGVRQNRALLASATLAFAPLLMPRVRTNLGAVLPYVVAGWTGFAAAVLYSCYVGGDAWNLVAGYDRHTAAASVLFAWSHCLLISSAARTWRTRALCTSWALLLTAAPVFMQDGAGQLQRGLLAERSPVRGNERDWIAYGKQLREVSLPGARIAVCPAGAIIYFSHRGGVDLLGKVEPLVAHLPVAQSRPRNMACWRNAPGHNKGDDAQVYAARKPELARGKLPGSERTNYFHIKYQGNTFFVRKQSNVLSARVRSP